MNTIRQLRQEEGFTLVELLIVIVVLGVLAGVTVLAVGGIDKRGVAAACRSDFKSVEVAQQAHFAKTGAYAASVDALVTARYLASAPAPKGYTVSTVGGNPATVPAAGSVTITPATGSAFTVITGCDTISEAGANS